MSSSQSTKSGSAHPRTSRSMRATAGLAVAQRTLHLGVDGGHGRVDGRGGPQDLVDRQHPIAHADEPPGEEVQLLAPVTEAMLDRAAVGPGDTVLDLACGPGGTGIAAAHRVGPGGEVTVSDGTPEMTQVAAARAEAAGLANVRARRLDREHLDRPDAPADVALCRDGLMLVAPSPPPASSQGCCAPAGASPSPCGGRAPPTPGSAPSSTPSPTTPACRSRRPASRGRSPSTTPTGWRRCCATAGIPGTSLVASARRA